MNRLRPIPEPAGSDENDQSGGMPVLDLHGYNKNAAIRRVTDFLDMHSTGDKSYVKIITGAGSHSGPEGPVLRTSIKKLLERRQMEINQDTPGSFVVNAASGVVLFSEGQSVDSKVVVIGREFGNGGLDDNGSNISEGIIRDTGQSSSLAGPLSASEIPTAACARAAPASPGGPLHNQQHHYHHNQPQPRHLHPGAAVPSSNSRGYDHGTNDDSKVLVVQRQGSDRKMAAIPSTPPVDAPGVSFSPSAVSHQQLQEQLIQRHHHHNHTHDNSEEGDREAKATAMGLISPDAMVERQHEEIRVMDQARYDSLEEQRIRQEREAQEELAVKEALRASLELSRQAETEEEELLRKAMMLSQQEQEKRKQLEEEERERQEMEFKKALELSHEVAAPDASREDEIVRRALELSEEEEEAKRRQKEEEAKKLEAELDDALRMSKKLQEEEAAKEQEMLRKAMEMSQNAQEEKKQYNEEDEDEMLRKAMEMSALHEEQERLEEEEAMKRILEQSKKQYAQAEGVASASVESEEEALQRVLKESMNSR